MATERKAAGDTCWRDGAIGGVHPLEKQEKRPSPAPIDPVSFVVVFLSNDASTMILPNDNYISISDLDSTLQISNNRPQAIGLTDPLILGH
ncbi:hypothetical protein ALC60_00251 [Trachymyrmex zeteki]|uniref:Uncharacterized protein n=1 Tax=Mycetomoellerius zeteki TaxID=64791 RepID=A0A151XJM9_9HYME|nr:hypothetical protein ALC60_00251 [Trachymyrmex zeteki]